MAKISEITCHKVVNSRGDWTIRTRVILDDGSIGIQTVPDGASKGKHEAVYVPVEKAIDHVTGVINDELKGQDPCHQGNIDRILVELDGTTNKEKLGGNSILSVSLAVSKAAAKSRGLPLYKHLAEIYGAKSHAIKFPVPIFNVINGGMHADNGLSIQEFMIIPAGRLPFDKAYEIGVNVYHTLEKNLKNAGFDTDVGDEGGFAPNGFTTRKALEFIRRSAEKNYKVGNEVFFGVDVAASSLKKLMNYAIPEESLYLSGEKLIEYYEGLINDFEFIYIEDPFHESDYKSWAAFNEKVARELFVVADDLVVTNPRILERVIPRKLANAVIVKPNQIGTLTETFEFIKMARSAGMAIVVSHRSGDTAEDTFIADLSVAVGADFIKSGAPARGERVAKYNRLYEIFLEG